MAVIVGDTILNIIEDALLEIGAYGPGDLPVTGSDATLAMRIINRELDAWAALKRFVWVYIFQVFTLTPGHFPNLIGPGLAAPDFAWPIRPPRIPGAALILNSSTPNVDLPITMRDKDWWQNQRVKTLSTNVPTDCYYEKDFPNGALNFWPVPATGYGVRLQLPTPILQFALPFDSPFSMPPGYKKALVLTAALRFCRPWGRPIPDGLAADAAQARADVFSNNIKSPRIASADIGGSGGSGGRRSGFNYYSGQ